MQAVKYYLFAQTNNYQGKVDPRFQDLAQQFSRMQDTRTEQGGAALVVYFQGKKVVDIWTGKSPKLNNGKPIRRQYVIPQAKVCLQRLHIF